MISADSLFAGELVCNQHKNGYRFSIDAVLAAYFCTVKKADHIVDLGAGSGVIGLVLAYRHQTCTVTGFELQSALCDLIKTNISANHFSDRMGCIEGDVCTVRQILKPECADLVVCNPPYGVLKTGRLNQDDEQTIARHEVRAKLADFIRAASFCVKNRGRVVFVLPASRLPELLSSMLEFRLQPKRMQMVYSYPGGAGKLVLVEGMKNGGSELMVQEPLFIYQEKNGEYSPELALMFAPESKHQGRDDS
jgi:tRNA1Val (adenine37-N6)-methyltransferase